MDYYELDQFCRAHGMREYFELRPKALLSQTKDDPDRVRYILNRCNGKNWRDEWDYPPDLTWGELYMDGHVTAAELAEKWTMQGYTTLIVKMTPLHFLGPRYKSKLKKIVENMNIGNWTLATVECSWSVVIATENPDDIKAFASFVKNT